MMTHEPMLEGWIKHMANRFLSWRLPENFHPDAGISFTPDFNVGTPYPMKHEPTGTNLFDADQAEQMVRYMAEGLPADPEAVKPGSYFEAMKAANARITELEAEAVMLREALCRMCAAYRELDATFNLDGYQSEHYDFAQAALNPSPVLVSEGRK